MTGPWQWGILRGEVAPAARPIVKIGGSLLARTDWPELLDALVREVDAPLLVVGGGSVVDGLRVIDAANPRPAALMHQLAIDGMSLTARLVADALGLRIVSAPTWNGSAVLDIAQWLAANDKPPNIPMSWEVTSDSLAAVAAVATDRPLVLVKSVPPPASATLEGLATAGWVDAWFPTAAYAIDAISWAVADDKHVVPT